MFLRNAARLLVHRSLPLVASRRLLYHAPSTVQATCSTSRVPNRHFSAQPPSTIVSTLSMGKYEEVSDKTMESLLDRLEELVDTNGLPGHEVEYHSGVLTLQVGDHGTYVINKQPPNKQIWLSSPTSGPKRYDFDTEKNDWLYSRDATSLGELLRDELKAVYQESEVADILGSGPFFERD